ncbi:MAG TPA: ATP-binding protein, partial [Chloroflexia bacterium]|nr:ATP-binding protein [Chloroflexia bacterium]
NKLENNPALLNLDQFCYNMVAEIKQGVGSANAIYYRSELEAGKEYLLDEKLLRQILYNLLVNACKYSYPASTISFVASQSHTEDEIVFQVKNEGPGILPEDLPHLFEAFHRGKNTGTIRGNGLGLTIVKTSLDLMGGNITIDSQVGDITTFTVALPAKSSLNLVPL